MLDITVTKDYVEMWQNMVTLNIFCLTVSVNELFWMTFV